MTIWLPSDFGQRKRLIHQARMAPLLAVVEPDEVVLALGGARGHPIVVTDRRVIRAGYESVVSVPFERIERVEHWTDAQGWSIRLVHEPIDPRPRPEAYQWWRVHDRRRYRRDVGRRWRETEFHFSHEHTKAADALRAGLERANVPFERLPSPPRPARLPPVPLVGADPGWVLGFGRRSRMLRRVLGRTGVGEPGSVLGFGGRSRRRWGRGG